MTPHVNFYVSLIKKTSRQIGEIYVEFFFLAVHIPFYRNLPTGQTPQRIFACDGSNDECAFCGLKKLEINI